MPTASVAWRVEEGPLPRSTDLVCTSCGRVLETGHEICPVDGTPIVRRPRTPVGRLLARRYRLDEFLGRGGWATVYRARDLRDDADVAVKILLPGRRPDPDSVRRFLAEAHLLAHLHHPHVVSVRDCGQSGRSVFLVLELLSGRSLSEETLREVPFAPARAVSIALQICEGLGAAHDRAIVHRDLKPDNVLLLRGGDRPYVKVADFGIARSLIDDVKGDGAFAGTPAYTSPEQARGDEATARSDFYSLGLVLYEMLAGGPAFPREAPLKTLQRRIQGPPPEIRRAFPDLVLPDGLGEVVARLVALSPADRPRNAAEVRALLAPFGDQTFVSPGAEPAEDYDLPSAFAPLDFSPPLSGRDPELARLLPFVRKLGDHPHAMTLLLAGPAGVGKSRLAAHLADVAVAERGARRITQSCNGDGRDLLAVLGGLIADLDAVALTTILGDAHGAAELLRILHPEPEDRAHESDVAAQTDYHCQVVLDTLAHFAARQPLVVVLDDAHAADSLTRAVVRRLPLWSRDRGKGLCFIVTWTTGPDPPADVERERFADRAQLVRLEPLSDPASDALLRSIGPLDAEARALIVRLAGGNPLHLFQVVRHLKNEKLLIPTRRDWRLAPRARFDPSVPPAAEGLARREVDQLRAREGAGALAADLLERAALVGDRVPLSLLRGLLEREGRTDLLERLDVLLDFLVAEDLLHRTDDAVVFRHALVREAIASRVEAHPGACSIHAAIAETMLEVGSPDRLRIASHLHHGGEPARALPLALEAAALSRSMGDLPRSRDAYQLAARILDSDNASDLAAAQQVHVGLGEVLLLQGDPAGAQRHFSQALKGEDLPDALAGLGRAAEATGAYGEALDHLGRASGLYRRAERLREAGDVLLWAAKVHERRGELDLARRSCEAAIELMTRAGDKARVAAARMTLGNLQIWAGDQRRALQLLEEAAADLEGSGTPSLLGECLYRVGTCHDALGAFETALAFYQRALRILQAVGHSRGVAACLANIGLDHAQLGNPGVAEVSLLAALRVREDIDDSYGLVQNLVNLGWTVRRSGRLDEAVQWLRQAVASAERINAQGGLAFAHAELAEAVRGLGGNDEAESLFTRGLALDPPGPLRAFCLDGLGDIARDRGDVAGARERYREAETVYRMGGLQSQANEVARKLQEVEKGSGE
jgi:serine/threonine protein kinase/tetratricopeptide (TPR) repeat protein